MGEKISLSATSGCFRVFTTCHDDASRFVRLLAKPGRMVLEFDDLVSVVQVGVTASFATVIG